MTTLRMRVQRIDMLTPTIRRLLLVSAAGIPLPEFAAGAHIALHIPACEHAERRSYSLVNAPDQRGHYEIAVQLEAAGAGGSRWVHQLEVGSELDVNPPRNNFPLDWSAGSFLLIAGGIGITPILSMARALQQAGKSYTLHYAARSASAMAYRDDVKELASATCWFDGGDPARGMPLADTIGPPEPGRHLYVCGPGKLIEAVLNHAKTLGWHETQLHSELFSATSNAADDDAFEVELAISRARLLVPAGKTALDVMIDAGLDPLFDCRRGDCGVCTVQLLEGDADHRDICLSAEDHARGDFCPCVSRAKSARLVLNL